MKKLLMNAGFSAAIALCAFAVPSRADIILAFGSSNPASTCTGAACGTATLGAGSTIAGFDIDNFTTLTVKSGATTVETFSLSGVDFKDTGTSYSLSFAATCTSGICGIGSVYNNLTNAITYTGATSTYSTVVSHESITLGAATSLSESAAFLNDLLLSAPTGTITTGGGASTVGTSGAGLDIAATSSTLSLEASTQIIVSPEPVSFLLFGTGLLAVGLIARQKKTKTAVQKA